MEKIIRKLETQGHIDTRELPQDLLKFYGECSAKEISLDIWNRIAVNKQYYVYFIYLLGLSYKTIQISFLEQNKIFKAYIIFIICKRFLFMKMGNQISLLQLCITYKLLKWIRLSMIPHLVEFIKETLIILLFKLSSPRLARKRILNKEIITSNKQFKHLILQELKMSNH